MKSIVTSLNNFTQSLQMIWRQKRKLEVNMLSTFKDTSLLPYFQNLKVFLKKERDVFHCVFREHFDVIENI